MMGLRCTLLPFNPNYHAETVATDLFNLIRSLIDVLMIIAQLIGVIVEARICNLY